MAKFIELHHDGERISLRVDLIASVTEYDDVRSTEVGMAGESGCWNVDESYDCVMEKIQAAEDEKAD